MKRNNLIFSIFTTMLFLGVMMILSNCEGPEGLPGPAGADGVNGTDGKDGKDVLTCNACHDLSEDLKAKIIQYSASTHANGGNFERNSTDCAVCHTSGGFIERIAAGTKTTAAAISNPTPINCRTCHNIHTEYDSTDWALTTIDPVTLWTDTTAIVDIGKGNLCAQCHHARPYGDLSGDSFTISSAYWGAHHGPQADILSGHGGYEVAGSKTYTNSAHTTMVAASNLKDGCVECHMAEAYGVQAGGHTWSMSYLYHGSEAVWLEGCIGCHGGSDAQKDALHVKIEDRHDKINALLVELSTLLQAEGVMDATDHAITGTYKSDLAGALINYNMVREDRSMGVHNFKYAEALLTNSIEAIK